MCRRIAIVIGLALAAVGGTDPTAFGDGLPLPVDGSDQASVGNLGGAYRYSAVSHRGRTTVLRIDAAGGEIDGSRTIDGQLSVPLVAYDGTASGLSADGRTLVLIVPRRTFPRQTTELRLLDAKTLREKRTIRLDGDFSFDAISPNGRFLYLIHYKSPRDPTDYEVRSYDVVRGALTRDPIVDPEEPDEKMTGIPQARVMSPDGRWAYTLYGGGEEMFIHALDTGAGTAVCVDLPQFDPRQLYRLGLSLDESSGAIAVLERGRPAATVDPRSFEVSPVEPADAAASSTGNGDADTDWVAAAAIAVGLTLLAGASVVAIRWRRRATA
jgi:hypothetical protein